MCVVHILPMFLLYEPEILSPNVDTIINEFDENYESGEEEDDLCLECEEIAFLTSASFAQSYPNFLPKKSTASEITNIDSNFSSSLPIMIQNPEEVNMNKSGGKEDGNGDGDADREDDGDRDDDGDGGYSSNSSKSSDGLGGENTDLEDKNSKVRLAKPFDFHA